MPLSTSFLRTRWTRYRLWVGLPVLAALYAFMPAGQAVVLLIGAIWLMMRVPDLAPQARQRALWVAGVTMALAMAYSAWRIGPAQPVLLAWQGVAALTWFAWLACLNQQATRVARLKDEVEQHRRGRRAAQRRAQESAIRDELTNLFNRRHMLDVLNTEKHRSNRSKRDFCLALIKVDHLRELNQRLGRQGADEVLSRVAQHIATTLRETDAVARWDGPCFLVMFPDTDADTAFLVVARIQRQLAAIETRQPVSLSAGVTLYARNELITQTLDRVDRGLQRARADARGGAIVIERADEPARSAGGAGGPPPAH